MADMRTPLAKLQNKYDQLKLAYEMSEESYRLGQLDIEDLKKKVAKLESVIAEIRSMVAGHG